jgi:hypothetical protein
VSAVALTPAASARELPPLSAAVRAAASPLLATTTRRPAVALPAPIVGRVSGDLAVAVRPAGRLSASAGRSAPLTPPRAHPGPAGGGRRLRTVRRRRVPWDAVARERLAAAWGRVQIEHSSLGELLLVGIFGPVPIDAVEAVALEPDGRLAMTFSRRAGSIRLGDVALARRVATGSLVRSDIPHPAGG